MICFSNWHVISICYGIRKVPFGRLYEEFIYLIFCTFLFIFLNQRIQHFAVSFENFIFSNISLILCFLRTVSRRGLCEGIRDDIEPHLNPLLQVRTFPDILALLPQEKGWDEVLLSRILFHRLVNRQLVSEYFTESANVFTCPTFINFTISTEFGTHKIVFRFDTFHLEIMRI